MNFLIFKVKLKEDLIININTFIEKVDELKLDKSKYNLNWFLDTLHSIEGLKS